MTKMIENFEGAFFLAYGLRSTVSSVRSSSKPSFLGEQSTTAHSCENSGKPRGWQSPIGEVLETASDRPILDHPSGGVLVLGRTLKDSGPLSTLGILGSMKAWTTGTTRTVLTSVTSASSVNMSNISRRRGTCDVYFSPTSCRIQPPTAEEG